MGAGDKIARVRWSLGQTLLPEHLVAQEDALLGEARLLSGLSGLPAHGLARLALNEPLLTEGVLALSALTVVLPGGPIVDVPGNATIAPLSLAAEGRAGLSVYLYLLREPRGAEDLALYEDDGPTLSRVIHRLRLGTEEMPEDAAAALKLMEIEKEMDGSFRVLSRYVPPLVQVGASPFLLAELRALGEGLDRFRAELLSQLRDTLLGQDRLGAVRRCLVATCDLSAQLHDVLGSIHRHPYHLFAALRTFALEAGAFQGSLPDQALLAYRHEDLGGCFGALLEVVTALIRPARARSTHLRFTRTDGLYFLGSIPREVAAAQEAYLLVQRPQVHEPVGLHGVKLAAPGRLELVHRLALRGVPLRQIDRPSFSHSFGPEVDFYQLGLGEEWELALREAALAFYALPALARAQFSLYWRNG